MKLEIHRDRTWAIAYDAELLSEPRPDHFSVEYWQSRQAINGEAVGRGSAWFIDAPFGPVVLRHYLRGGWAAAVSRQHYFFTGVSGSRPFREFHLLADLHQSGLPVPRPVAALCRHHGLFSTGAIITVRIPSTETLADLLTGAAMSKDDWHSVGSCIRQLHDAGVWHADLNARNILLDSDRKVFLIDFDRARFNPGNAVNGKANLNRLKRSLQKLYSEKELPALQLAWTELEAGYAR